MTKIDELERLEKLREKGSLTEEEFAQAKRALLNKKSRASILATAAVALLAVIAVATIWLVIRPKEIQLRTEQGRFSASAAQNTDSAMTTEEEKSQPAVPPTAPKSKYQQLVSTTLIGGNLPFFESISGPARQVIGDGHRYEIDGCDVWVETEGATIKSITSEISGRCNPDLGYQLNGRTLAQAASHFGNGRYSASCLRSCGNAVDPSYSLEIDGYHANNWISYRFEGMADSDGDYDRLFAWAAKMERERGEDYVIMGRYHCDNRYASEAASAIRDFRVTSVTITTEFRRLAEAGCA